MKQITKEKLKNIVSSLMLEPKEEILDNIIENWNQIQKELKKLDLLDLNNVKPMVHIDETTFVDFFREDEIDESFSISKVDLLKNASQKDQDYIITTKVVK
ncbi:Asp-tRNA(Asn)/Glu-tRNA(Gln) amidotransferase subunit GatC [Mycoplasmopsis cricetuli]|uniref:glutamyl-tRNA amidotransferase n=1 Tax=Mycoplasmopsis cricetuli TaxID=171283 RepID=UPI00046EF4C7|nr:glutamyl-tRNA amidotransferase [Mycoplasmopsis cricetuli]